MCTVVVPKVGIYGIPSDFIFRILPFLSAFVLGTHRELSKLKSIFVLRLIL